MLLLWFILIVNVRPLSVCLWLNVQCMLLLWFILIVNLFVFDLLLNVFRIALWPSIGKELSLWLVTCAVLSWCRLNCRCPFPVWCLGQDVEFDCIGS